MQRYHGVNVSCMAERVLWRNTTHVIAEADPPPLHNYNGVQCVLTHSGLSVCVCVCVCVCACAYGWGQVVLLLVSHHLSSLDIAVWRYPRLSVIQ